ncbi:hypothetical protein [Listeria booriae]|uniref:Uncharacterized protein n=1 Tax=Listeria booriae TaxID=1552123 RepID=A0A842ES61_9LIST|nr:hypothetical protein [Listeria booriae]MBC1210408.1 hypothetical protein [Listeria booriae]MBC1233084.1 hypothetical protein [Listeria booriae]MBC2241890.1 hypothetical protein [Listeria booriae]HAC0982369.1 hypothetical protein [Listeria monocytogenes]
MNNNTIEQDFNQFCFMRIEAICEADANHEEFQANSKHYYQLRDQLEALWQPEILTYLDALEKYQVEAFLYIYKTAFKEGVQFIKNK